MIPVEPQPEPETFDAAVRRKGRRWLRTRKLLGRTQAPSGLVLEPYWRACDLHRRYGGAYLGIFIEPVTGAGTVDHFIAKSKRLDLAYEWTNYRLACAKMNARKGETDDVLDPFALAAETFHLNLLDGSIRPHPKLRGAARKRAQATIDRLGLDDAECRSLRIGYIQEHMAGDISAAHLARRAPFVWSEARRLGLLEEGEAQKPRTRGGRARRSSPSRHAKPSKQRRTPSS